MTRIIFVILIALVIVNVIIILIITNALRATSATALGIAGCWLQNPTKMKAKIDEVGCPNRPKKGKKSIQNLSKIDQKSILAALGGVLGPS